MSSMNYVKAAAITSIASSSVTSSLQVINTSGFPGPASMIRLINASTKDVAVSFDGAHANDYVQSGAVLQISAQTNAIPTSWSSVFKKGTKVYVSGDAGTGYIYLAVYYVDNQ